MCNLKQDVDEVNEQYDNLKCSRSKVFSFDNISILYNVKL